MGNIQRRPDVGFVFGSRRRGGRLIATNLFPTSSDSSVDILHKTHHLLRSLFSGNFSAPVGDILKAGNAEVLDIGCGPATWLSDVASDYQASHFHGIDVNLFCESTPANVQLHKGNVIEGLPWQDETFDFVYLRFMLSAFTASQWMDVLKEISRVLKPGGWIEMMEFERNFYNVGTAGTLLQNSVMAEFRSRNLDPLIIIKFPELIRDTHRFHKVEHIGANFAVGSWGGNTGTIMQDLYLQTFSLLSQQLAKQMKIDKSRYQSILRDFVNEVNDCKTMAKYHRYFAQKL